MCGHYRAWACNQLAFLYAKGNLKILSLFESSKKAKELYQKACDGGNANGCAGLGEMNRTMQKRMSFIKKLVTTMTDMVAVALPHCTIRGWA